MSLRRLVVENYRCFRDQQEIDIAPVTVVLGKNHSGKSVLARAPMVLATGFDTDSTAPLDLDRLEPESVDSFPDLIFRKITHGKIHLAAEVTGQTPFALSATIQYVDEARTAFVSQLSLRTPDVEVALVWQPALLVTAGAPMDYEIRTPNGTTIRRVPFQGLLPVPDGLPELRALRGLTLSPGPVRYLSPYRERAARLHRLPFGMPRSIGIHGEGTAGILAHDRARERGEVIEAVNRRLRAIVPGWELNEIGEGRGWATVLTHVPSGTRVDLTDAGSGLAQVLPILVQCALDEVRGTSGKADAPLQIIEEPETHLHPAAHAELADLYLATAKTTGTRFLIETHSETLLLRLRRRIAEANEYGPEMVAVYVVEQHGGISTVRRVGVDRLGNLDGWPEDYFSQDYHEVRALAAAQLDRSGDAA